MIIVAHAEEKQLKDVESKLKNFIDNLRVKF
jgi:hypothetical protein